MPPVLTLVSDSTARPDPIALAAKHAAEFLKALANENRLSIMCLLAQGEHSVSELERVLALRQPSVSQQLARLRADGLVSTRRAGKTIYYSLASPDTGPLLNAVIAAFRNGRKAG